MSNPTPPRDVLNKETNARFWAQTHYKPGQKLDPANPTDKAMMPVWMGIFRKVSAEAATGKLVLTYDHPEVAQKLSDAEVASKAAVAHLDAAASAPDAATAQQNAAAAALAAQLGAQKAREAAAVQPPSVSPKTAADAARAAAAVPPPPHASSADQIAHAQTQTMAPSASSSSDPLVWETNQRFWARTHYKPGQKLNMADPTDRKMAKIWMEIFHAVQREAAAGKTASMPVHTHPAPLPPRPVTMPPFGPPAAAPSAPFGPPQAPEDLMPPMEPSVTPPPAEPAKKMSIGKMLAIGAAVAAAGGIVYLLTRDTGNPASSSASTKALPPSRPRTQRPNVYIATPTRPTRMVRPTRLLRA